MLELRYLNEEEIINNADIQESLKKGLVQDDNYELYQKVQALYKMAFDSYIEKIINFNSEVDQAMKRINLNYGIIGNTEKNMFHKFSYLHSDFIFVRNYFYIEKLDKKYIELLVNKINNKDYEIDDEMDAMVKNTYKNVIKEDSNEIEEPFYVFYGPATPSFQFYNNSLVFFLNYGENTIELSDDEFIENQIKQEEYLDKLTNTIKDKLAQNLDCNIEIKYRQGKIPVHYRFRK